MPLYLLSIDQLHSGIDGIKADIESLATKFKPMSEWLLEAAPFYVVHDILLSTDPEHIGLPANTLQYIYCSRKAHSNISAYKYDPARVIAFSRELARNKESLENLLYVLRTTATKKNLVTIEVNLNTPSFKLLSDYIQISAEEVKSNLEAANNLKNSRFSKVKAIYDWLNSSASTHEFYEVNSYCPVRHFSLDAGVFIASVDRTHSGFNVSDYKEELALYSSACENSEFWHDAHRNRTFSNEPVTLSALVN